MKRIFSYLLLAALSVTTVVAQTAPKHITLNIEEFAYKPSTTSKAMTVLSVFSSSSGLWLPDKSMAPQMNEAAVSGAVNIPWIDKADEGSADYTLKGHFTQLEIMTGNPENVVVRARTSIIDNKTGKEVGTKIVQGSSSTFLSFDNTATMKARAAMDFSYFMQRFIFEALPVTGHILEKGVEQANGKVKEKQCYVDLGTLHGVVPEMMLYVTEDGKYKAELRIVEVLGDDICACKIVKGDSYITKSLAKGVEVTVTSRPKKIDTQL
ncbi:MAG: hypothetical protein MJZ35_09295 [Bacteroidaceae bacterium]|nr:hypothetical protein [Bacteroidaceae bacterium]